MLSIWGLLGGGATVQSALSKDTMVGAKISAAARKEGCRASTSVEDEKYTTRKLQVALLKKSRYYTYISKFDFVQLP